MTDPTPVYVVKPPPSKAEALMSAGCALTLIVWVFIPLALLIVFGLIAMVS